MTDVVTTNAAMERPMFIATLSANCANGGSATKTGSAMLSPF